MYYEKEEFKQAAWWYKQAEVRALRAEDVKLISLVYSSLGYVNMQLNLFPEALAAGFWPPGCCSGVPRGKNSCKSF